MLCVSQIFKTAEILLTFPASKIVECQFANRWQSYVHDWTKTLLRIWEVLSWNTVPWTGYSNRIFL